MARTAKIAKSLKKPKFKVRVRNRCRCCGRARGYIRKFQMCRICFRGMALKGEIPGVTEIRPVVGGLGISILTTPKGLMSGRAARRAKLGGEILCEVW